MKASDRFHFSDFADEPEFVSIGDYDDHYDLESSEIPDEFWDEVDVDDTDEFIGNDI
ncbi:hypothetical protein D1AOALGA4SA_11631 [Olavius algarvensis Delta 1 endosymbiont]|nr:hypothetical protein D1AOALGA4SA_11631 [Olavius algarvensis Delta 1 endosymbiont]